MQITFSPFLIAADMYTERWPSGQQAAAVQVGLRLHVEGPKPWSGTGFAEFQFLFWDVRVPGRGRRRGGRGERRHGVAFAEELERALSDPESWAAASSPAAVPDVCLRPLDPVAEAIWLAPDSRVEVRQSVLPLNREIQVYGALVPTGQTRFDVEAAGLAAGVGSAWDAVQDWFAPARDIHPDDAERAAVRAVVRVDGHRRLADRDRLTVPTAAANTAAVTLGYDQKILSRSRRFRAHLLKAQPDQILARWQRPTVVFLFGYCSSCLARSCLFTPVSIRSGSSFE